MSGASMAASSRPNQGLNHKGEEKVPKGKDTPLEGAVGGVMGSFRLMELQLVAFIIVLSASGLVAVQDLLFPVVITCYSFILTAVVFPSYSKGPVPDVFKGNRFFQLWILLGTVIGLFVPLAYVLGGFARGDRESVLIAASPLFLLSFQILSENIISALGIFSLPVRALLVILYTSRRLFSLAEWTVDTFASGLRPPSTEAVMSPIFSDELWMWFGRGLAAANLVYYILNLFVFLIPAFLPRAFETYFKQRDAYKPGEKEKKSE